MISKSQAKKLKKRLKRWLLKISLLPKVVPCDLCKRLAISDPERLSLEYCRRVNISFRCGSCLYPQYQYTLCTPTRGNIGGIYGYRFVLKLNKFIPLEITQSQLPVLEVTT